MPSKRHINDGHLGVILHDQIATFNVNRAQASERLRQAAIAIGLALLIGATTLLRPIDITVWSLQAKLFDRQPSEDIALVQIEYGDVARDQAAQNRQLLSVMETLADSGAELIALDMPVQRSSSPQVDAALRKIFQDNRDRVILTRTVNKQSDRFGETKPNDRFFEHGMRLASNDYKSDFLGYVWGIESEYDAGGVVYPSLWSVLAERRTGDSYGLSLDYVINLEGFKVVRPSDPSFENAIATNSFTGKKLIVGPVYSLRTPAGMSATPALLHALATESYAQNRGLSIPAYAMVIVFALFLIGGLIVIKSDNKRREFYLLWSAVLPINIVFFAYIGVRAGFGELIALVSIYAISRMVSRYKRRHLLFEPRSKLPNFVAFRRDLDESSFDIRNPVAVAKIARLDSVFTTLTVVEQGRYLRQVAKRLSLGDKRTTVYYDGGKYFAFILDNAHLDDIEDHLLGLRAIASQAVTIDGRVLDVSMTIGVHESSEVVTPSSRLSSAIAAADQAREAYRPVFVITNGESNIENWDYSLQARLEEALEQDRIAINLQPQADFGSGRIVGAESLARWIDRERGDVPPSQFITQCERVGRLDDLTRRVLAKTLAATAQIQARGFDAQIAVNVSAIQFVDERIADLFEKELAQHAVDPAGLTIEVTETARIEDYRTARDIIERIKTMGPKFAIDDFGVGSANFEAIYELPFDEIKIDRLFVSRLTASRTARSIVSSLASLARDGSFLSVAEGIEDRETYALLKELGCDRGQGYYIGRPQQAEQFMQTLDIQTENWNAHSKLG